MLCAFLNNIFKLSILFKILAPSNGTAGIRLNDPSARFITKHLCRNTSLCKKFHNIYKKCIKELKKGERKVEL